MKNTYIESEERMMLDKNQRLELLIEIRKKGITQSYVADQVGISNSMLSQYLSNKSNLTKENEDRLINVIKEAKMKTFVWKKVLLEE